MWLRCFMLLTLVVALVSCLEVTPEKESTKVIEEHTKEMEKDIKEVEKTTEHDRRKPVVLPTEPVFKHPIKDGKISGAVLVPLGLGQISGSGHLTSQNTFSIEVFRSQVVKITKQIEELRASLQLLLTKYQSQRNANMKAIITKYKSGIQRLRSDKLRIEGLIRCVMNPASSGCGGSNYGQPAKITSGSIVDVDITGNIQQPSFPVLPYPTQHPTQQIRFPQYEKYDWAQIASQLALLNAKYMASNQNVGGVGFDYGSTNYPTSMPMVNVFNGHSSYGAKDTGFSSMYNMGSYGKAPAYVNPGFGGRQPLVPGMNAGNLEYADFGMSSFGKDSFGMINEQTDMTSTEFLGSLEGGSLLESSLFGTDTLSELDSMVGIGDFEQQQFGTGSLGYGQMIGYLIPSTEFNLGEGGLKPVEPFIPEKPLVPSIPEDVEIDLYSAELKKRPTYEMPTPHEETM